jgi:site-specific recombinase XerD
MSAKQNKRNYGSGSVIVHRGAWYGRWWVGTRYVKRKLGEIRQSGSREGLTHKQAEMALRRMMTEVRVVAPEEQMSFQEAGDRYLHHLEHVKQRKASTIQDYKIMLNKHFVPHFGSKSVERIGTREVAGYIAAKSVAKDKGGLGHKTIVNHLNFAHGVFAFALKHGWCTSNPVAATDRPQMGQVDPDIRFLDLAELDRHFKRSLHKGDDHLVFCHPQTGEPYDASQIRKRFYAAMAEAGMGPRCKREGGITFHSLRHTFGTRMAAHGVPMRTLQEWMGHRNLATTEIYADYAPDPAYGAKFAEGAFTAKVVEEGEEAAEGQEDVAGQDVASGEDAGVGEA